jgi:hypothetical protein
MPNEEKDVALQEEQETGETATEEETEEQNASEKKDNDSEAIISKLRKENARRRIEAKELKSQLEALQGKTKETPDVRQSDDRIEMLQRKINALQINNLAEKKGVDSEVLEALISKRGIDLADPDAAELVDDLIKEKGLVKKRQSFGNSVQRTEPPGQKPKTIDEYLKIQAERLMN